MKLISTTPYQKILMLKLSFLILCFLLVMAVPFWFFFLRGGSAEDELQERIMDTATDNLKNDDMVTEFTLDDLELSYTNDASEDVYRLEFSVKSINPDSFILAGRGVKGEDGWVHQLENYVTVRNDKSLVFSTIPEEQDSH
ncbi:MAG: hypothetical protein ABS934_09910 [Psychrobacillus sp.]